MDPNVCLRKIRRLIENVLEQDLGGDADELATHVEALDEWLCKGGFFPEVWTQGIERA